MILPIVGLFFFLCSGFLLLPFSVNEVRSFSHGSGSLHHGLKRPDLILDVAREVQAKALLLVQARTLG